MKGSFKEREFAQDYVIKNEINGYLNAAAGWQAIERVVMVLQFSGVVKVDLHLSF